jgi:ubiquinone/menaquinone biosynthesis C-methylase UbiE
MTSKEWDEAAYDSYISIVASRLSNYSKDALLLVPPNITDKVLEIACGPGILSIEAAKMGVNKIIATDWSEKMIKSLKNNIKKENEDICNRIETKVEDGQLLSTIKDNSIDLTYSMFGIFLFEDIDLSLKSVYRVLKSGGKIITSIWDPILTPSPTNMSILRIIAKHIENQELDIPNNKNEFKEKLRKAGFINIKVISTSHTFCFANKKELIKFYMGRNPVIDKFLLKIDEEEFKKIEKEILKHVYQDNIDNEECIVYSKAYIFIAEKPN